MNTYKTNDPAVVAACDQEREDKALLQAEIDAFAARFGGKGLMYADPARLAGIKFSPAKPRDLWRAPDHNGLQHPRSAPLKGASAEVKAELKALQAEWRDNFPARDIDTDAIYRALGFGNCTDFLFEGLMLFQHEGFVYARTKKVMPRMTEILGSEFEAAHRALRQAGAG